MTPAEHYLEAERLLSRINEVPTTRGDGRELPWEPIATTIATLVARAQVHATLAQVEDRTFRQTSPVGELSDKELRVLRDAIIDAKSIRESTASTAVTSLRVMLLDSAASKLKLWERPVNVVGDLSDEKERAADV